jgi:pterin-4a-carbinolamine dehydratase
MKEFISEEKIKYKDDFDDFNATCKFIKEIALLTKKESEEYDLDDAAFNRLKTNQKIKTQEIEKLKKDSIVAQTNFKKKMDEIKKEMQDSSKKIASF